jgi:uncharacterized coiled-coil protein SlyX
MLAVEREIEEIPEAQFAIAQEQQIVEYVAAKHEISPLVIDEANAQAERREISLRCEDFGRTVLVDGLSLDVTIPYTGEIGLWRQKPNPWREPFPTGTVKAQSDEHGYLEISVCSPVNAPGNAFNQLLERRLENIKFYLAQQNEAIDEFNAAIPSRVTELIAKRRQKLDKIGEIAETFKIPLRRREGAPNLSMIPVKRRLVRPLPPAPDKPQQFGIPDEDYEHILSVIRHEGRTYEATPSTYAIHDEEGLRDIILAHLNGHYQGDATGETFRKKGQTDIRIEFRDRAAFVAECKVWRGQKELRKAIDQLLGYLTWRDCRSSIIIFNKHVVGFSRIQNTLPSVLESHPHFVRGLSHSPAGEWRYEFTSPDDADQHVTVHVFLFNLYADGNSEDANR